MKIAMLIARFPPALGGAEIQCFRLSRWLAKQGHEVVVLTEKSSRLSPSLERVDGVTIVRFHTWGPTTIASLYYSAQAFFYLLRHDRFDILHAHMIASPAMVACVVSSLTRTPLVVKMAGGRQTGDFGTSRRSAAGRFKLWLFKQFHPFVVTPSRETFEEAKAFGVSEEKLKYIPNGVDRGEFREPAERKNAIRERLKLPPDLLLAIYVGRWAKGKGVETLMELWEKGRSRFAFPWHLLMVLSEPLPEAIARRARSLGDSLHTVIGVRDPVPYYQSSDLAILLSEGEGMSNFLLEAMACGLPTLSTQAAALPDAQEEKTGTRTLASSASVVEDALSFLIETAAHRGTLISMGRAARESVERHYTLERAGQAYVSLYKEMVN